MRPDWLSDPSREPPMRDAEVDENAASRFWGGFLDGVIIGGSLGFVVLFLALLTQWRFGLS